MKKIMLAALAVVALYGTAKAQSVSLNSGDNKPYFGVRVSGNIICPQDVDVDVNYNGGPNINGKFDWFKVGGGLEVGAIYNIPIFMNLYVEPGLSLFYNSYGTKKEFYKAIDGDAKGLSFRKFGFRIPVLVGYHFDFSGDLNVSVFTGPEMEVGLYGQNCWNYKHSQLREDLYVDEDENVFAQNRFNMYWNFGVGVNWKKYYFGVKGGVGMCDMFKSSAMKLRENRVALTVGYNF